MSQQNRRQSQIPQIRHSSSTFNLESGQASQSSKLARTSSVDASSRQSMANHRSSSIDPSNRQSLANSNNNRPSLARQSSFGGAGCLSRPSIGTTLKPNEAYNIANEIHRVLLDLDFKQAISPKDLTIPSTSQFYVVFEFFIKNLGFGGNDVWNADILVKRNYAADVSSNKNNKNQPISQSQASGQAQVIAQNKIKIDLIIFYLTLLKYNNIPKLTVLQTMTTPKNWSHMLQILLFLANNCWFLVLYDSKKILSNFDPHFKFHHPVYEYLKHAFSRHLQDESFLGSDKHKQMKNEFYRKYESICTQGYNLDNLKQEKSIIMRKYEQALETRRIFDESGKEEQELIRILNEEERLIALEKTQTEEKRKIFNMKKNENIIQREKLIRMEEEVALKDAEYDKQLASGKQMDNLVNRHQQKVQKLDQLQNNYMDLGKQKDDLQSKVMRKSAEVQEKIGSINDLVNKIKLSSSIAIDQFPQFDFLDFHKKTDLIQQYKESLSEIRKIYNVEVCKLPEILSQCREEKKQIESQIESIKTKNINTEKEIKRSETYFDNHKKEAEDILSVMKRKQAEQRAILLEKDKIKKELIEEIVCEEEKLQQEQETTERIKFDSQIEILNGKKKAEEAYLLGKQSIEAVENELVADLQIKTKNLIEFNKKLSQFNSCQ